MAALLLAACVLPAAASDGRTTRPHIERATKGERCIDEVPTMRREHMNMLKHQRDATVHGGIRGARASLQGCIDCHASARTGSVAQAPTDFCIGCHAYAAVKIDCFDCHRTRPAALRQAATPEGPK